MEKRIGVIIPAAGAGRRLGGITKPLIEVGGKPILLRLLGLFAHLKNVVRICVAAPEGVLTEFRKIAEDSGAAQLIEIVGGGAERALSVKRAYDSLRSFLSDDDLVCIHDAARPLLSKDDLTRVVDAAWEHGAAFLAARVNDTLKIVDEKGTCVSTIDRRNVYAAQTPQVMKAGFLKKGYETVPDCSTFTDEIMLMEKIGVKAFVVEPKNLNMKLTAPGDLKLIMNLIDSNV